MIDIDLIHKYFPKLEINDTKLITEGWESDILVASAKMSEKAKIWEIKTRIY